MPIIRFIKNISALHVQLASSQVHLFVNAFAVCISFFSLYIYRDSNCSNFVDTNRDISSVRKDIEAGRRFDALKSFLGNRVFVIKSLLNTSFVFTMHNEEPYATCAGMAHRLKLQDPYLQIPPFN